MRVWDISTEKLCKNHLLGEHRELHAIWNIFAHKIKKVIQIIQKQYAGKES